MEDKVNWTDSLLDSLGSLAFTWCNNNHNCSLFIYTAAIIKNVVVTVLTSTSASVSWDRLQISEITHYVIYYQLTENGKKKAIESLSVNSIKRSEDITGLINNAEYQFQVAAQAVVAGITIVGEKSPPIVKSLLETTPSAFTPTTSPTTSPTASTISCKYYTYTVLRVRI